MTYHPEWFRNQMRVFVLLATGMAIVVFIVYLPTLAPTITWRNGGADSGDFAAAIVTSGIPHPPGYPTYVLLGRIWTTLPFPGDPAYQLNLLSAVTAAVAAGMSTFTIGLLGRRMALTGLALLVGAGFGGVAFAFTPLVWSQATITEIYSPGLMMLSLMNVLLFWWWYQNRRWALLAAGLVGGLGLGLFPQLGLALPGALALLVFKKRNDRQSWRLRWPQRLLPFLLAVALGLTTFITLPLRAAAQPMVNWGDPQTLARFWAVVTADAYHQYLRLLTPDEWLTRLFDSVVQVGHQLSWAGLGLGLLGTVVLWRKERAITAYLGSLIGLALIFRTSYPVAGNPVYLIPTIYGLALFAGVGVAWLLTLAQQQIGPKFTLALGIGLLIIFAVRVAMIAPNIDISADQSAASFSRQTLNSLPPDAVIVSEYDETTFSLWYQQALGQRPDVVIIDDRLLYFDWYRQHLLRQYPDLNPAGVKPEHLRELTRPVFVISGLPEEAVIVPLP